MAEAGQTPKPEDETPFDPDEFERELFRCNPWAASALDLAEPEFDNFGRPASAHTRRLSLARQIVSVLRLRGGRDAFNAWSAGMTDLRGELERAGLWPVTDANKDHPHARLANRWHFLALIDIRKLRFDDDLNCSGFQFPHAVQAEGATFNGYADFRSATFNGYANFISATFKRNAYFESATFKENATFESATFNGDATFKSATFNGDAAFFESATFKRNANFESATFKRNAFFESATFKENATFRSATFNGDAAFFESATFKRNANFESATFNGTAFFESATFNGYANFISATFNGYATFQSATFNGTAYFATADFDGVTSFNSATFDGPAVFQAIKATRAFSLARAEFFEVPDFIQAEFSEAPRLDNFHIRRPVVRPRRFWLPGGDYKSTLKRRLNQTRHLRRRPRLRKHLIRAAIPNEIVSCWFRDGVERTKRRLAGNSDNVDPDVTAKCRALRGIAGKAHDPDREAEFRAMEVRMARFNEDWPLPIRPFRWRWKDRKDFWGRVTSKDPNRAILASALPLHFWDGQMWVGSVRFWLGWAYGVLSDFGRSVVRPLLLWAALIGIFTCVYLSGHLDRAAYDAKRYSTNDYVSETFRALDFTWHAAREGMACVETDRDNIIALKPEVRENTNAFWQAFRMSLANAVVFGDLGGTEGARLAYGCLFGLERLVPKKAGLSADKRSWFSITYMPPDMLWATRLQKALSALLIFLFGLAMRNLLKVK